MNRIGTLNERETLFLKVVFVMLAKRKMILTELLERGGIMLLTFLY
jgi:hypothetical protein